MTKQVFLFRAFGYGSTNGSPSTAAVVVTAADKPTAKAAALAHLKARKVLGSNVTGSDVAALVARNVALFPQYKGVIDQIEV